MEVLVKSVGWIAFATGLVFIIVPFAAPDSLSFDTAVSLMMFLLVTGPLLVGLSHLIGIAARIQENTSWFSTGIPSIDPQPMSKAPSAAADDQTPFSGQDEPRSAALPQGAFERDTNQPEDKPASAPETPAGTAGNPAGEPVPQLYDANQHPAAVEEWSHQGRRVMTLEDGTFATEVDGAWYRFLRLEEIDALDR
ncbi:MAG: hypothetical protein ACR2OM_05400 [Aestuariivirgaceae bacterium]